MSLIKSISGIRGTIGGPAGEGLTPVDIVKFVYAYCKCTGARKVVVGKDARISGAMVEDLVCGTLTACGVDVVKCGFASTPTTEMAVGFAAADGGIIITASHNPRQWNALKLLNSKGEFLTATEGAAILECAEEDSFDFAEVDKLGKVQEVDYTDAHIAEVLKLKAVDAEAVRKAGFTVVLDAVNSVGGIIMPRLLDALGVKCIELNCEPSGNFAHNPEPLPANLTDLCDAVVRNHADLGISVDPDVDRLALICEDGEPFVEENTLVAVADYLLGLEPDSSRRITVSNLSSSRGLRDVTEKHGGRYYAAAVGEVNVTSRMHEVGALIGGEGNGGVIYPACHCGRDAMVGVALILSHLAHLKLSLGEYKKTLPSYFIAKNRLELSDPSKVDVVLGKLKEHFAGEEIIDIDGVKIVFESSRSWVHLRKSNTEPIIRIYSEAPTEEEAVCLARQVIEIANVFI